MGEERDDLMRRGALLEDGALLMPAVRTKQGVPAGSVCPRGPWCRKHDRAPLRDPGGVSGRVYLCLLF